MAASSLHITDSDLSLTSSKSLATLSCAHKLGLVPPAARAGLLRLLVPGPLSLLLHRHLLSKHLLGAGHHGRCCTNTAPVIHGPRGALFPLRGCRHTGSAVAGAGCDLSQVRRGLTQTSTGCPATGNRANTGTSYDTVLRMLRFHVSVFAFENVTAVFPEVSEEQSGLL